MNRAKLIKRGTTSGQKTIAQTASAKPAAKMTGKVVKAWLAERRAASQTEARQAFDALFT